MTDFQEKIVNEFMVLPEEDFDPLFEIERRVDFLKDEIVKNKKSGLVLGISGGQDSFLAGKIAQMAISDLRTTGGQYMFYAMRLPYGAQRDEADATVSIEAIGADRVITYNVKPAVDASVAEFLTNGIDIGDYQKGNIKARFRMAAQFDIASLNNCLVVGTDHAAEAVMGFYTKFGDGACDIAPLSTLNKRQGRKMAELLGAPKEILRKKPTADLEDNNPGLPDEVSLGITYNEIDDFLEGKEVSAEAEEKIRNQYTKTEHKRLPILKI